MLCLVLYLCINDGNWEKAQVTIKSRKMRLQSYKYTYDDYLQAYLGALVKNIKLMKK